MSYIDVCAFKREDEEPKVDEGAKPAINLKLSKRKPKMTLREVKDGGLDYSKILELKPPKAQVIEYFKLKIQKLIDDSDEDEDED
jgi:hypothetical protein